MTLTAPDGMRLRAPNRILIAESTADTLSEVSVDAAADTGVRVVLSNRLDRPSALAVSAPRVRSAAPSGSTTRP